MKRVVKWAMVAAVLGVLWLTRHVVVLLALFTLMAFGCAGADDMASDDDASASSPDAATTDVAPAKTERTVPLCEGSPEESPDLCQRLVYGTHGYCNQWIDCSSIH